MKPGIEMHFFSHISNEVCTFEAGERWAKIAEKVVKYLNAELANYPDEFYYLKSKIKGGFKYYAGSIVDPSHWGDAKFAKLIEPDYEPPASKKQRPQS